MDLEPEVSCSEVTLRDIRQLSGLSQAAFAKRYGFALTTVKAWEAPEGTSYRRVCPEYIKNLLYESVLAHTGKAARRLDIGSKTASFSYRVPDGSEMVCFYRSDRMTEEEARDLAEGRYFSIEPDIMVVSREQAESFCLL